jgi:hypothetical protein
MVRSYLSHSGVMVPTSEVGTVLTVRGYISASKRAVSADGLYTVGKKGMAGLISSHVSAQVAAFSAPKSSVIVRNILVSLANAIFAFMFAVPFV